MKTAKEIPNDRTLGHLGGINMEQLKRFQIVQRCTI